MKINEAKKILNDNGYLVGYTNSEGSVENCNGKLVLDTSMPT